MYPSSEPTCRLCIPSIDGENGKLDGIQNVVYKLEYFSRNQSKSRIPSSKQRCYYFVAVRVDVAYCAGVGAGVDETQIWLNKNTCNSIQVFLKGWGWGLFQRTFIRARVPACQNTYHFTNNIEIKWFWLDLSFLSHCPYLFWTRK